MDSYQLMFISSFSVLIPLSFSLINFKQINQLFYPFISLIFLNFINETIAWVMLIKMIEGLRYLYNVYFLCEALIILWQFKVWGLFTYKKYLFYLIAVLYLLVWTLDSLYFDSAGKLNSYFIVLYSFCVILMSLHMLYQIMKEDTPKIVGHPIFIICTTYLFFYVYTVITEALSLYPIYSKADTGFKWQILNLLNVINIISNLGYALGVTQIQKRQRSHFI